MTIIIAVGIGPLVAGNQFLMVLLALAGALYLIWLGVNLLRQPVVPAIHAEDTTGSRLSAAVKGAMVSGLNPKSFVFFLAFLPPFTVVGAAWVLPMQLFILGMIYTFSCLVVYMLVGYGAHIVLSTRPEATRVVSRLLGIFGPDNPAGYQAGAASYEFR